ncbi:hypothetical protein ACIA8O_36735 [Kitasatospora sp. NPDC051853]|uniref:hypothetical protein n=1 Tax=Kitasatospora sp. NPDC051853 TaxID=3364058 RepID=UPI0037B97F12
MKTDPRLMTAMRWSVTIGAALTAPLLLVGGGFAYDALRDHLYGDGGPGALDKRAGWVHPGYFVLTNRLVLALTWPTRQGGPIRKWPYQHHH